MDDDTDYEPSEPDPTQSADYDFEDYYTLREIHESDDCDCGASTFDACTCYDS